MDTNDKMYIMKKKLSLILQIVCLCAMNACSDQYKKDLGTKMVPQEEDYVIPIDAALNSLDDFLSGQGIIKTKSEKESYIKNYFSVSGSPKTRAANQTTLYAVNFQNDRGYALLAADNRIPEEILAVVDYGNVSEKDFMLIDDNRVPTENDDITVHEFEEMVRSGALARLSREMNLACLDYADKEIDDFNTNPHGGGGGGSPTYEWRTEKEVPKLLSTLWTQEGEENLFNKYCPTVGLLWKNTAPAGCVCIAIAQIMAFHEYPQNLTCNDVYIDYPLIKQIYSVDDLWEKGTAASREMLAQYIITVGRWCNTQYHSIFNESWGFAWPSDGKQCLSVFGYENVSLNIGYDEDLVLNSLDRRCPVFMSAISGLIGGHAWVIDGYVKRNYVSTAGYVAKKQTLVHCNWGWHGDCNGYFTSGVFRTQDAEIRDGYGQEMDKNYWFAFNTITYDNPNEE